MLDSNIISLIALTLANTLSSTNPLIIAILIIIYSIAASLFIFNTILTSWLPLILVIVFSSGMMTLFIYVASLTPNENNSSKMPFWAAPILLLSSSLPTTTNSSAQSMNTFSNQVMMTMIAAVLILAIVSISSQSFNPSQSISSTF